MKKAYIYILIATILFSSMEMVLKMISGAFHPLQITYSRFLLGGICLIPFALHVLKEKQLKVGKRDMGYFALLGLINVVIGMVCYQLAVNHADASFVAVLFSSNPVFVMLLAYFILKEPIYKNNIIALVFELVGIVIIVNPFGERFNGFGVFFAMISTVMFSLYGVLGKRQSEKFGGIVNTCYSFLFGGGELCLLILFTKIGPVASFLSAHGLGVFANVPLLQGFHLHTIIPFLYIALGVTGAGFVCYFKAMELTSANTASLVFFFKPVLAPIFAIIFLHEIIPGRMDIGIGFILIGSMATLIPNLVAERQNNIQQKIEQNVE